MNKKEAIKKAYGAGFKEYDVTENGYSSKSNGKFYPEIHWHPHLPHLWRPNALLGIENNNGWKRVENESDLPLVYGHYWVIWEGVISDRHFIRSGDIEKQREDWLNNATYYQPIDKPKPPIY